MSSENLPIAAYSIPKFCKAHSMSRGKLYQLWKAGLGPRWMKIGAKRLIPVEAAADWRRQGMAREAGAEAA
jgi:hypothetical protein